MIRRFGALAVALSMLVLAALPAGAQTNPVGTAQTTANLATLTIAGLPVALQGINLGTVRSFASTDTNTQQNPAAKPFARSVVSLPLFGDLTAVSDGDQGRAPQTFTLPGGAGTLTTGALSATVTDGVARSLIGGLSADLTATIAGLAAQLPAAGARSLVDATSASATNGVVLSNLSLGLTDLIPLEVLEQLPLETLLALLDGLPLQLPADVTGLVNQVRDLVDSLEAVATVQGLLADATAELDALNAELDELNALLAPLQATVASLTADRDLLETTIEALEAELAILVAALGGLVCPDAGPLLCDPIEALQAQIAEATEELAAVVIELEAAIAQVNDLQSAIALLTTQINALGDTIAGLVDQLNGLLDTILDLVAGLDLADLVATVAGLVEGLAGFELLGLSEVAVGVGTTASATASSGTALCTVRGVRVLGGLAPASVDTCQELQSILGDVQLAVLGLLRDLPVVGEVAGGAVTARGLTTSTSVPNQRQGDYFTAAAAVEGLTLAVEPLSLTRVTDGLVATVDALIADLVAQLAALTGVTVDLTAVEAALAELDGLLAQLPTGDLTGVVTPRVAIQALDVSSASSFAAAVAVTPTTPPAPPQIGTPPPPAAPPAQLPVTGGGVVLGLAMLAAGGFGLARLRRRTV
jgi:ABC-type transporter Mla subunit MlaD